MSDFDLAVIFTGLWVLWGMAIVHLFWPHRASRFASWLVRSTWKVRPVETSQFDRAGIRNEAKAR